MSWARTRGPSNHREHALWYLLKSVYTSQISRRARFGLVLKETIMSHCSGRAAKEAKVTQGNCRWMCAQGSGDTDCIFHIDVTEGRFPRPSRPAVFDRWLLCSLIICGSQYWPSFHPEVRVVHFLRDLGLLLVIWAQHPAPWSRLSVDSVLCDLLGRESHHFLYYMLLQQND